MSNKKLTPEAEAARNALRAQTIGPSPVFESVLVDVFVEQRDPKDSKKLLRNPSTGALVGNKQTFALVPPSIQSRGYMLSKAGVRAGGIPENPALLQALSIIECCRVPGFEDTHAFEETDLQSILTYPTGGWPDRIYPEIQKLMARSDIEEAKKNSVETGASASPSSSPES